MKKRMGLALLAAVLSALPAVATTVQYVPLAKSIDLSEVVALGKVVQIESAYNAQGEIVTVVRLEVEEAFKGGLAAGEVLAFHAWGGRLDGVNVETVGEARYLPGERILVQLERVGGEYHTLGLSFGKWNVRRDLAGTQILQRSLGDLRLVDAPGVPVEQLPLNAMKLMVHQRLERE